MRGLVLTLLATALSLLVVDFVFAGVEIANFPVAIAAAISIGIVNAIVKPILTILSFPLTLLTLGGFLLVLNGICFSLASVFVQGFQVHGLLAFLLGPILLSLTNAFLNRYLITDTPSQGTDGERS
ncbi:phage holin family protein [Acaryochloris sp. IP29b_bin.137]|uniref:phage holin family protein n=1 Tax=Acaryochloris sp. IP29b_bin.137 TaxID=2969217 RepID=UPI00261D762D|nr:phage holin family protein [Acaryochloris sp. IP29b_bin.137]